MSHAPRVFFAAAAILAFALPVSAQEVRSTLAGAEAVSAISPEVTPAPAQEARVPVTSARSPLIQGPTAASLLFVVPSPRMAPDAPPAPVLAPSSQNVALMIVGGAGLLVGAVIGGDEGTIIMIAGGSVGLLGLYRYLR